MTALPTVDAEVGVVDDGLLLSLLGSDHSPLGVHAVGCFVLVALLADYHG